MGVVVPERCDGDFEMVSCCVARFDLVSVLFDLCVGGEAPSNQCLLGLFLAAGRATWRVR